MTAKPRRPARTRSRKPATLEVHQAPLAIASDGTLLVNMHHWDGACDPQLLVDHAAELGGAVFIGIAVQPAEHRQALVQLDDAATSAAASLLARLVAKKRRQSPA